MCIAIYKPEGIGLPSSKVLQRCWDGNPDGGGYCYIKGGIVVGYKGFMDFDAFETHINHRLSIESPAILHFRIATHGSLDKTATHPFPLSCQERPLRASHWSSKAGVAHNGIIPGYGNERGKGQSDTQAFISQVLAYPGIRERLFNNKAIQRLILQASGSKWIFLRSDGKAVLLGKWEKVDGIWYSNDSYRAWERRAGNEWYASYKHTATKKFVAGNLVTGKTITKSGQPDYNKIIPEDFAPPFCPYVNSDDGTARECLDCNYFDSKDSYCELFDFDPI